MEYTQLLSTYEDGILLVTINREKALNALNKTVFNELHHVFSEGLSAYPDLRGVILCGTGEKAFAAGADIKEFSSLDAASGSRLAKRGQDVFFLIERASVPVIAAIQGYALGGGCELAMACHMRVAGEKARFGQPEVNLGIIPGYGATQRLTQLIGKCKALELLMTADMIKADEALRLGLVNYVVPQGEEIEKARAILKKIASKAPGAVAKIIQCVNAYYQDGEDGFQKEVDEFGGCVETEDFKEGVQAFMEKRAADFKGK